MASIQEYLNQIREAIYGEEVRGSIINAITAMNNESSQAKSEAVSSAEQARASANSAKISETKATQAQDHAAKIDKMTVSALKLSSGENPTVNISDDGTKKHLTFGIPKGDTGVTPNISMTASTGVAGSNVVIEKSGTATNPTFSLTIPRGNTGAQGPIGNTPDISVKVNTGTAGSNVSVEKSGTAENPVLTFTIPRGNTGATPSISAKAVNGEVGSNATVAVSGNAENPILTFTIPRGNKGDKGDTGPIPKLKIGTVTTGQPGTSASATLTGTAEEPVLNLIIPEGQRGVTEGVPLTDIPAKPLANTASAGTSNEVARADHEHKKPTPVDIGALALTGGTVQGNMRVNGTISVHTFDGEYDKNGYANFAQIKITDGYQDSPIMLEIIGRWATQSMVLYLSFMANEDHDPYIKKFYYTGDNSNGNVYIAKSDISTWDLYISKLGNIYAAWEITRYATNNSRMGGTKIEWKNGIADTLPEGAIEATKLIDDVNEIGAVSFNSQDLTDTQKQQARNNIGAGAVTSVNGQTGDVVIQNLESGPTLSNAVPKPLADIAAAGMSAEAARADHEHPLPTPTAISAIGFISQTLTDEQKAQARSNIGAGTSSFSGNYTDLHEKPALFSGSYNDLTDKPSMPTKVSQLQNDSGFLSTAPVTSVNGKTGDVVIEASGGGLALSDSDPSDLGETSAAGTSIKASRSDHMHKMPTCEELKAVRYNASQTLNPGQRLMARTNIGAGTSNFSGSYNDLTNKPTIPTKVSQLTYDVTTFICVNSTATVLSEGGNGSVSLSQSILNARAIFIKTGSNGNESPIILIGNFSDNLMYVGYISSYNSTFMTRWVRLYFGGSGTIMRCSLTSDGQSISIGNIYAVF